MRDDGGGVLKCDGCGYCFRLGDYEYEELVFRIWDMVCLLCLSVFVMGVDFEVLCCLGWW